MLFAIPLSINGTEPALLAAMAFVAIVYVMRRRLNR